MSLFSKLLLGLLALQMAIGLFQMFGHSGVPLYKRAIAAFGSLGMAICIVALAFAPDPGDPFEHRDPSYPIAAALILVNLSLAVRLIDHFRRGDPQFSCLGSIGRILGCAAIAWGTFALVMFAIVLMMGLAAQIPSISYSPS